MARSTHLFLAAALLQLAIFSALRRLVPLLPLRAGYPVHRRSTPHYGREYETAHICTAVLYSRGFFLRLLPSPTVGAASGADDDRDSGSAIALSRLSMDDQRELARRIVAHVLAQALARPRRARAPAARPSAKIAQAALQKARPCEIRSPRRTRAPSGV